MSVDLEAVPQPRLDDALAVFDLGDEPPDVDVQVAVDPRDVVGDDSAEQQAAEAGGGIGRQHEVPEREPARRRQRTRVEDLDLGEQHDRRPTRTAGRPIAARTPAR